MAITLCGNAFRAIENTKRNQQKDKSSHLMCALIIYIYICWHVLVNERRCVSTRLNSTDIDICVGLYEINNSTQRAQTKLYSVD